MNFKDHLAANISLEYGSEPYLDYTLLESIIREVSENATSSTDLESRQVSLTSTPQSNILGLEVRTEDDFFRLLEQEMKKVESFTLTEVTGLRKKLTAVERKIATNKRLAAAAESYADHYDENNDDDEYDGDDKISVRTSDKEGSSDDDSSDDQDHKAGKKNLSSTDGEHVEEISAVTDDNKLAEKNNDNKNTNKENISIDIKNVGALGSKYDSDASDDSDQSDSDDDTNDTVVTSYGELMELAAEVAEDLLRLEKYVNINFMGFQKILEKHDEWIPNNPCKWFYVNRLHTQAWVRGDYSDLVVRLSYIHSTVREDRTGLDSGAPDTVFLRKTKKYWVKTEDVSLVKVAILRHLPVFLQKTHVGDSDSQLVNSVYLDNSQLELYHDRLDKKPESKAVRLRWYGTDDPQTVFVEQKTSDNKWTGKNAVKERFIVDESEVQQVLTNTYPIEKKKQEMEENKNKTEQEIEKWEKLAREMTQMIASKQLVPTIRTQYLRTAFQIPFDASTRISLDTHLCMISERGYDTQNSKIWHRDMAEAPEQSLNENEITYRFPHAVLEIKIELSAGNEKAPKWVTDLQESGLLHEINRFSKYGMGCAVLLPEDIAYAPYFLDDVTLRDSIVAAGASRILADESVGVGPGANAIYDHLLPFGDTVRDRRNTAGVSGSEIASSLVEASHMVRVDSKGNVLKTTNGGNEIPPSSDTPNKAEQLEDGLGFEGRDIDQRSGQYNATFDDDDIDDRFCGSWLFPCCSPDAEEEHLGSLGPDNLKGHFSNERTLISWLTKSAFLSAFGSSILSLSEGSSSADNGVTIICAMGLLVIAVCIIIFSLYKFLWRSYCIKRNIPGEMGDAIGPYTLGGALVIVLLAVFSTNIYDIVSNSLYSSEMSRTESRHLLNQSLYEFSSVVIAEAHAKMPQSDHYHFPGMY